MGGRELGGELGAHELGALVLEAVVEPEAERAHAEAVALLADAAFAEIDDLAPVAQRAVDDRPLFKGGVGEVRGLSHVSLHQLRIPPPHQGRRAPRASLPSGRHRLRAERAARGLEDLVTATMDSLVSEHSQRSAEAELASLRSR